MTSQINDQMKTGINNDPDRLDLGQGEICTNCSDMNQREQLVEVFSNLIDMEYDEAYVVDPYDEGMDPFEWEDQEEEEPRDEIYYYING